MQSDAARVFAAVDPKIDMTHVDFFERKAKRTISREKFAASHGPSGLPHRVIGSRL
jgi:hypothetical protein